MHTSVRRPQPHHPQPIGIAQQDLRDADQALVDLGRRLSERGYRFTTITPDSHRRVNERAGNAIAEDLAGVFGWNRPFCIGTVPEDLQRLMERGGILRAQDMLFRSGVRFSTVAGRLLMHSAFPTVERDAVFLGPDTYRFVRAVREVVPAGGTLIDLGCGTGAGGLALADRLARLVLTDINPLAARFARINALIAGCEAEVAAGDLFGRIGGSFDTIIANPPYLEDADHRLYRDGGGGDGLGLALRIVAESIPRLSRRGRLVLYTGVPVIAGRDHFLERILPLIEGAALPWSYDELDVDVFGDELSRSDYATTDRLAVVLLQVGPGLIDGPVGAIDRRSASHALHLTR